MAAPHLKHVLARAGIQQFNGNAVTQCDFSHRGSMPLEAAAARG